MTVVNLCCIESTKSRHLETGISAQDERPTFHGTFEFWGFPSNWILNVPPQGFNGFEDRGLNWPPHYPNPFCLEPRRCSLTRVFGVVVVHNLFKYFDVFNGSMTPGRWQIGPKKKKPHTMPFVPPCLTVFTEYCGLNSVPGGHLTYCCWPLGPNRTVLLSSVHRMLHHSSLGQSVRCWANFNRFCACRCSTMVLYRGFLPIA